MPPSVSVCLPTYNGAEHLPAAIESVLAQDLQDFELIITDDCSQDNSFDIASAYAKQDRRVHVFRNRRNLGLFRNYNESMKKASGEIFKLFAQDDLLKQDALSKFYEAFQLFPDVALVSSNRKFIDRNGEELIEMLPGPSAGEYFKPHQRIDGLQVIVKSCFPIVNFIGEPSAVAFRPLLKGSGFDCRFHHLGDLEFWLRLLSKGDFYFLSEQLCSFRVHKNSQSNANERGLLFIPDQMKVWRKFGHLLQTLGYSEEFFYSKAVDTISQDVSAFVALSRLDLAEIQSPQTLPSLPTFSNPDRHLSQQTHQQLVSDLIDFREFACRTLLALVRKSNNHENVIESDSAAIVPSLPGFKTTTAKKNQVRIRTLESNLRKILSCPSWVVTKPLRDVNSISQKPTGKVAVAHPRKSPNLTQREYIVHLRQQIKSIKKSRSWYITRPIREWSKGKRMIVLFAASVVFSSSAVFAETTASKRQTTGTTSGRQANHHEPVHVTAKIESPKASASAKPSSLPQQRAKSLVVLGITAFEKKDSAAALANFNQAANLDPELPQAFHYRGMLRILKHDFSNGEADLRTASVLYQKVGDTNGFRVVSRNLERFKKLVPKAR